VRWWYQIIFTNHDGISKPFPTSEPRACSNTTTQKRSNAVAGTNLFLWRNEMVITLYIVAMLFITLLIEIKLRKEGR
jgi:hypothetical protein